jgi:type 1 glutamine amidotransferase
MRTGRRAIPMSQSMRFVCACAKCLMVAAPIFGQEKSFHVLAFYSTTVEQDHVEFAMQAIPFYQAMAAKDDFEFKTTKNWNDMNAEVLSHYQVVMWLDDRPSTPAQRLAFQNYMEHGGGWLGFHIAGYMSGRKEWPWFADFIGTVFSGNNWPPLPAKIDVDDPDHPVTKGFPVSYTSPANEWYSWNPDPRLSSGIKVLMTLDPSNYPIGFKNTRTHGDIPVTRTNTKYRMLYTNMGHGNKIFDSKLQNSFFENALLWLGGRMQ